MPGLQDATFWEGHRAETLVQYLLSTVAAVVPVPRAVDFGHDLQCTLLEQQEKALYSRRDFNVQVKLDSDSAEFVYGGRQGRRWKRYEIEWLFNRDQALFVCLANTDTGRVRLYSTTRMWHLRVRAWPGRVRLRPDETIPDRSNWQTTGRYNSRCLPLPTGCERCGDGRSHDVPLGPPIWDLNARENTPPELRKVLAKTLEQWLEIDYKNILHSRLRIPITIEWQHWQRNAPPTPPLKIIHNRSNRPDDHIPEILRSIAPAVASLLHNLNAQTRRQDLDSVVGVARLIKDYGFLDRTVDDILSGLESD